VTHYFFEGCRYTTPLQNDPLKGRIKKRRAKDAREKGGLSGLLRNALGRLKS